VIAERNTSSSHFSRRIFADYARADNSLPLRSWRHRCNTQSCRSEPRFSEYPTVWSQRSSN